MLQGINNAQRRVVRGRANRRRDRNIIIVLTETKYN